MIYIIVNESETFDVHKWQSLIATLFLNVTYQRTTFIARVTGNKSRSKSKQNNVKYDLMCSHHKKKVSIDRV
ncbi:hypothetical protein BLOT_015246 [Blomia tropicalis]|nr:hypothetical protein BLOT_015246 [Blomia tropicalis]